MNSLEEQIGYKFRDPHLLAEALTHPSVAHESGEQRRIDNQRLEFLGDAVLQLVVTEHLFAAYAQEPEGRLTKLRARIVSRAALQRHALAFDLGRHLRMGRGEEASGGRERPSTLGDAFEALLGAIYLDSDFATVRDFILRAAAAELAGMAADPVDVNPKGQLQEVLQSIAPRGPVYELLSQAGPEHEKTFVVEVRWEGIVLGEGTGRSKKQAETEAAQLALQLERWKETAPAPADHSLGE